MSIAILQKHFVSLSEDLQVEAINFITTLTTLQQKKVEETQFWNLIDKIDWQVDGDYKAVLPLDESLADNDDDIIRQYRTKYGGTYPRGNVDHPFLSEAERLIYDALIREEEYLLLPAYQTA